MAGAFVSIDVTDDELRAALQRLAHALGPGLGAAMREIGEEMVLATQERFRTQAGPDGVAWAPLTRRYAASRRKRKSPEILVLRGLLQGLIRYEATSDTVSWGTDRAYGATHQFGRAEKNIPARPFLGLSDDDRATVIAIIEDHLLNSAEPLI